MTLGRVRREAAALYMKKKMNPLRVQTTEVAAIYYNESESDEEKRKRGF